jgi:hypothetical protein
MEKKTFSYSLHSKGTRKGDNYPAPCNFASLFVLHYARTLRRMWTKG